MKGKGGGNRGEWGNFRFPPIVFYKIFRLFFII